MLVIMALVTTFATTPVFRRVWRDGGFAGERATHAATPPGEPAQFPAMLCVADPAPEPGLGHTSATLSTAVGPGD